MSYPFQLKPLNYAYDALEPFLDKKTMEIHHNEHLGTYVTNLNKALAPYPEFHSFSIEQLVSK